MAAPDNKNIGKPPFFRRWSGMYWLLVAVLVVQIIIYYIITISY